MKIKRRGHRIKATVEIRTNLAWVSKLKVQFWLAAGKPERAARVQIGRWRFKNVPSHKAWVPVFAYDAIPALAKWKPRAV